MKKGLVRAALVVTLAAALVLGAPAASFGGVEPSPFLGTILLASGLNYPDALAAGVLSSAYDAPLLLTKTNDLPDVVAAEIKRSGATRIIILGGESVVGPEVVTELRALGISGLEIERVAGTTRFATSVAIAARAAVALDEAHNARIDETQALIDDAVASVQAEIDDLAQRLGLVEEDVADVDTRLASVETSLTAEADFWPEELTVEISEPQVTAIMGASSYSIDVEYTIRGLYDDGYEMDIDDDRLTIWRVNGQMADFPATAYYCGVWGEYARGSGPTHVAGATWNWFFSQRLSSSPHLRRTIACNCVGSWQSPSKSSAIPRQSDSDSRSISRSLVRCSWFSTPRGASRISTRRVSMY